MAERLLLAAAAGLAAGVAGALVMLRRAKVGRAPIDVPDTRRLHAQPTPRAGGVGILWAGGAALILGCAGPSDWSLRPMAVIVLAWMLPNGVLGWFDDHHPVRAEVKLLTQVASACLAVSLGLELPPESLGVPGAVSALLSVLWLVWIANAFNFVDGADGLAAGCGSIAALGVALCAFTANGRGLATLGTALAAALAGFLAFNRAPARLFMGDTGSLAAGAGLGGLCLALTRAPSQALPLEASLLLLGGFLWDATYTLGRRVVKRLPMEPHQTHLYQRLLRAGWSPARVGRLYLGLGVAGLVATLLHRHAPVAGQRLVLVGGAAAGLALVWMVGRVEARARRRAARARVRLASGAVGRIESP